MNPQKSSWILYMSTFPPRECGMATFTKDLATVMDRKFDHKIKSKILAMNKNTINIYNYPDDVIFQIDDENVQEYIDVAKKINETKAIKLVNIQHEFGIFGGKYGKYLIYFVEMLKKPLIVTFHSVLPNPDNERKKVVQSIAKKALCLIVTNKLAVEILRNDYGLDTDIVVIPHGVHPVEFKTRTKEKIRMGYKNKIILLSFGLMIKDKGYEYVIEALPEVIKRFPNVLYLIIGETHPSEREKRGETYRNFLKKKIEELHLQEHVKFYNKYLKLNEIIKYLEMTDIYIASCLKPYQMTSGTLSYAMGCGRVIISTPYLHAKDVVTPERGLLVKFKNSKSFADAIIKVLSNPSLKEKMERNAYAYTRHMIWPNVAESYMKLFNKYVKLF
jgi:glycosyltransferase involved in cell wall biosynthesis